MLSSCNQTSNSNPINSVEKIVIKKVEFSIYTIVSVKCEDFEDQFKDEYLVSTLSNKRDIDNFLAIFNKSEPLDSSFHNYIVDTRVKAEIYYDDGSVENICIGNPADKKDGIFYQNTDKIREYIEAIKPD